MSASELNYAPLDVKLQRRLRPNSNDKVNLVSLVEMLEGTATEERRNEIHKKMRSRSEEIEIIINLLLHQPIRHRHNGERGAQHDNDEKKR
jgi:hypothetical protein